jgi:hypothetical protein
MIIHNPAEFSQEKAEGLLKEILGQVDQAIKHLSEKRPSSLTYQRLCFQRHITS